MIDLPPDTSGEKITIQPAIGDVIKFNVEDKSSADGYEFLVIDVNEEYGTLEAMRLPVNGSNIYGVAGTEPISYVGEVLYRMKFDDIVKCIARSFMPDPAQDIPKKLIVTFEEMMRKKLGD